MKNLIFQVLVFIALSIGLSGLTGCQNPSYPNGDPADGSAVETEKNAADENRGDRAEKKTSRYPPLPTAIATAEIEDLDGETFRVRDKKGKVLVLNLWATWCVPCIAEMPHLVEMQEKHGDEDLEVIGLNVGDGGGVPEPKELIEAFAEKQKLNYEIARADRQLFNEFVRLTQVPAIPQTVIVNRDGRMTGIFTGGSAKNFAKMKQVVEKTLKE